MTLFKYILGIIPPDVRVALEHVNGYSAYPFHMDCIKTLNRLGFSTRKDVLVENRGDGRRGKIDIIAIRGDQILAIELDRRIPRLKSIFKVQRYAGATGRAVICRDAIPY